MRHTFPMVNIAISSVWTVHTRRITLLGPIQTRISILTFFWEHKFKDIETSHEHQPSYRQQLNELWPLMLVVFSCLTLSRHAPAFANAPLSYSNAFDNFELFYMGDCVRHSRISPRSTRLRFFFCLPAYIHSARYIISAKWLQIGRRCPVCVRSTHHHHHNHHNQLHMPRFHFNVCAPEICYHSVVGCAVCGVQWKNNAQEKKNNFYFSMSPVARPRRDHFVDGDSGRLLWHNVLAIVIK